MSVFRNFAVVGAGGLGSFIVHELLKQKALGNVGNVAVLSRSIVGLEHLSPPGAQLVSLDYSNLAALTPVLREIDVVISTVGKPAVPMQSALAKVAKDSGVKLFVPSEFGMPTIGGTTGLWGLKDAQRRGLEEIGLPYALFFTGAFCDISFGPDLGFDLPNGKVLLAGTGNNLVSFTSREDIARYVVHVLTSLPPSKLENSIFRIESERTTHLKVLEEYEAATGKKLDIAHEPVDSLRTTLQNNPTDFRAAMFLGFEAGNGVVGKPEEVTNAEYPEWNPKTVLEILLSL